MRRREYRVEAAQVVGAVSLMILLLRFALYLARPFLLILAIEVLSGRAMDYTPWSWCAAWLAIWATSGRRPGLEIGTR